MRLLTLIAIVSLLGCSSPEQVNNDINYEVNRMHYMERTLWDLEKDNSGLANIIGNSEPISELVKNCNDTLALFEDFLIQTTGGYDEEWPFSRIHLINTEVTELPTIMRENPLGIDLDFLNQVAKKMSDKGFDIFYPAVDATDDPIYLADPNVDGKDWFELKFENRNVYEGLTAILEVKIANLLLERRFLQSRLKPCNRSDSQAN